MDAHGFLVSLNQGFTSSFLLLTVRKRGEGREQD